MIIQPMLYDGPTPDNTTRCGIVCNGSFVNYLLSSSSPDSSKNRPRAYSIYSEAPFPCCQKKLNIFDALYNTYVNHYLDKHGEL